MRLRSRQVPVSMREEMGEGTSKAAFTSSLKLHTTEISGINSERMAGLEAG